MAQDLHSLLVFLTSPSIHQPGVVKLEPLDHPDQQLHMVIFYEACLTQPHA